MIVSLFGAEAYTDGAIILHGKPPKGMRSPLTPKCTAIEKLLSDKRAPLEGVTFIKTANSPRYAYFDELPMPICAMYYDHILKSFPGAVFHKPKGTWRSPITISHDGKIIGAVMCVEITKPQER